MFFWRRVCSEVLDNKNEISDFYITGADAVACVKSTCYNLTKMKLFIRKELNYLRLKVKGLLSAKAD
ncbi:MAG: hypothetical protein LBK58_15850 [Prevotellaceae bacterium]|jgi:hypothetical protein|nr:hypothetical protein [Prevotellaceae bacterium]